MAVKLQQPKFAKDFWSIFLKRAQWVFLLAELIAFAVIILSMLATGFLQHQLLNALIILAAFLFLSGVTTIFMLSYVMRPLRDILQAIVHISGEPSLAPPNPNNPKYEKDGFRDVLQTLYELDSQRSKTANASIVKNTGPSRSLLSAALDETSCGFVIMSHDRQISYANKAAPIAIDKDGVSHLSLLFPENNTLDQWLDQADQSAVHAEMLWNRVADRLPDEEGRRFFDVLASYDKGAPAEVVLTLVDRTNLYGVSEEELDFIAFAAHELRGPITVIRGYADVLTDELSSTLTDEQKELFRRLIVSANRLSNYVNNILNTSRYDRRHLKVHLSEKSVADVYNTIRDDMALRASSQNRLLSVAIPTTLPTIPADTASLGEVFSNLIDNAIKYSSDGGTIEVAAEQKGDFVEFTVTDHGIGMPGSVVSNLFQKFYRSHRSRENVAGSGIGLYISKAIVESHGGNISARSVEGSGSVFTVTLPTYASVADKLATDNEALLSDRHGWIKNHAMYRG